VANKEEMEASVVMAKEEAEARPLSVVEKEDKLGSAAGAYEEDKGQGLEERQGGGGWVCGRGDRVG
jgi:hypothetical protein